MTQNIDFTTIILICCLSITITTSCGSHVKKTDDAFDLVKKARMLSEDSSFVSEKVIKESMKTVIVKKYEAPDEWTQLKNETEKKIRLNARKIKALKELPDVNARLLRKVESLEKNNNELRTKMDEYKEEEKVKWEMFKASISHQSNEISLDLSAIKTDNK